jgi:hypothetical protein
MSYAKSLRNSLKDKNESLYERLKLIEPAARSVLTYTGSSLLCIDSAEIAVVVRFQRTY